MVSEGKVKGVGVDRESRLLTIRLGCLICLLIRYPWRWADGGGDPALSQAYLPDGRDCDEAGRDWDLPVHINALRAEMQVGISE